MVKSLNITGTKRLYNFDLDTSKRYTNLYEAVKGSWYNKNDCEWYQIVNIKVKKYLLQILINEEFSDNN